MGEPNVRLTTGTTVPAGCSTVIVAEVNATSTMASVQFGWRRVHRPMSDPGGRRRARKPASGSPKLNGSAETIAGGAARHLH